MTRTAGTAVFVSYRRRDTSHLAGRLFDRLVDRFGADNVFMDVDSIQAGSDYREAINHAVERSDVMLALIGTGWLNATDESGRRRLEKSDDVVVLELVAALDRNIRIVPVLVDGARMPGQDELPVALHPLVRRHAVQLDHQTFRSDAESLVAAILGSTDNLLSSGSGRVMATSRVASAPRRVVQSAAGVVANVALTILRPRFDQVPGLLAVLAAALLVVSVLAEGTRGLRAHDLSLRSYVLGMAVIAVVAGGCALVSRTRSSIGPGLLLGAATASTWGLGILLGGLAFLYRFDDPEYWLRLAGHVSLTVAAGLAVRTLQRDGAVRLMFRLPGQALTWIAIILGLAGAAALFGELWQVSHLEYLNSRARTVATLVAAVLALVIPLGAVMLAPRRIGASLLAGWVCGGAAIAVGTCVWVLGLDDTLHDPQSLAPAATFGCTLLLLALLAAWLVRLPDPVTPVPAATGPRRLRRIVVLASIAVVVPAAVGIGIVVVRAPPVLGAFLADLAVSPDGRRLYVLSSADLVSVVDTATNTAIGDPIRVGPSSCCLAASPDRIHVYVSNSADVSVIDTATNSIVGSPIPVPSPRRLTVSPDGRRVYTAAPGADSVAVIDTAVNSALGSPISVGQSPSDVVVSPDGRQIYVAGSVGLSVVDTATNTVVGNPIPIGGDGAGPVAVNPDGRHVYVISSTGLNEAVSVVDTATNTVVGNPIPLPNGPAFDVEVSPDGSDVYVASLFSKRVTVRWAQRTPITG